MILRKKLVQDIREQKGTFIALTAIIGAGLCLFIAMFITVDSLTIAIDQYYEEYQFGDVFATVNGITKRQADKISLSGIDKVTASVSKDVRVVLPDNDDNVSIRLLSYDPLDEGALNRPYLFEGEAIETGSENIYLNPSFAAAHQLKQGDTLPVVIDGRVRNLKIGGIAQSPEYVYVISDSSDIFANPALFGVALMSEKEMGQLFNESLEMNSLSFALETGWVFEDVEIPLQSLLKKYGLKTLISRADQSSHFTLNGEVTQLAGMGQSLPFLLLFISFVILIITLQRKVEAQRGQIGIMLAFGYHKWEIMLHYMSYGFLAGFLGGIAGSILGLLLASGLVETYKGHFTIPNLAMTIGWGYLGLGMFLAISSAVLACILGCRKMLKLHPAEAMRLPAPMTGRTVIFEKIPFIWNLLTKSGKMAVRNMVRAPFRSFVSLAGVAMVFGIMTVIFSLSSMMDLMVVGQFERVEVYNGKMSFSGYADDIQVKNELNKYEGVAIVETMLEFAVELRNQNHVKDVVIIGLEEDSTLYNLYDQSGNKIDSPSGLILSERLAETLDVFAGDIIYLDAELLKEPIPVMVEAIIPQHLGSNGYMKMTELWQIANQQGIVSAALLRAEGDTLKELREEYQFSELVSGISRPDEMFSMYVDYLDTYYVMIFVMGIAVSAVGFIIVYNSAIISFAERSRELASLLVLGMHDDEAAQMISFEQWILSVGGMIVGIPCAYSMNDVLVASLQNDVYSMPNQVPLNALFLAGIVTCGYVALAQFRINQRMKSLVIVDVLKERE